MVEKKINEIITGKLIGKWCDGVALVEITNDAVTIRNIYAIDGVANPLTDYPLLLNEQVFSKVAELDFQKAVMRFKENNCTIISPIVTTDEIITVDGFKSIPYGGNVYRPFADGKVLINDEVRLDSFDEAEFYINEKERYGKWLTFKK